MPPQPEMDVDYFLHYLGAAAIMFGMKYYEKPTMVYVKLLTEEIEE